MSNTISTISAVKFGDYALHQQFFPAGYFVDLEEEFWSYSIVRVTENTGDGRIFTTGQIYGKNCSCQQVYLKGIYHHFANLQPHRRLFFSRLVPWNKQVIPNLSPKGEHLEVVRDYYRTRAPVIEPEWAGDRLVARLVDLQFPLAMLKAKLQELAPFYCFDSNEGEIYHLFPGNRMTISQLKEQISNLGLLPLYSRPLPNCIGTIEALRSDGIH